MGKARVLSALGEGLYTIEIIEDRARAESARAIAVSRTQDLEQRITQRETEVEALQDNVDQAVLEQDQAIALHQQQLAAEGESDVDLVAYAQAVVAAAAERDRVRSQARQLQIELLALQARIDRIDALPPLRQVQAWCADYTEDLTGEVATAEVPGEIGKVLIKPGFEDGAAWSPSVDGAMQPALSGTPAGVFYHLAMLPGWQKWRPTFRIATITAITNDLCDITLDSATSSQQGLNVNAASAYDNVPIYYMDCNGDAFEEGDRVLVAFSGQTGSPMVVGFEKEPKPCLAFDFSVPLYRLENISYNYFFARTEIVGGDSYQYEWEWTGEWDQLSDENREPHTYGVFHFRDFTVPKVNPQPAETAEYVNGIYQVDITAQHTLSDYSMEAMSQSSTEKKEFTVEVKKDQVTRTIKLEVTTLKSVERFLSPELEPVGSILDHQSTASLTVDGQPIAHTIQGDAIPTAIHRPVTLRLQSSYDTHWFTQPTGGDFQQFESYFTVTGSVYTESGVLNVQLNVPVFPLFIGQSDAELSHHVLHIQIPEGDPPTLVEG